MIERVILMCAGRAERWGNYLGVQKHLLLIDGETLLDRTLRLVRRYTSAPIVIVAFNPEYDRDGHERFEPSHGPLNFCDTDKFLSAKERWAESGQTVILYGDVFFTDAAIKTIISHVGEHRFFGRREHSYITGRQWREMFALSFPAEERAELGEHLFQLRSDLLAGKISRGGGWELFRRIHGYTWNQFTAIDDFTDDFDYPKDYDQWIRRYRNPIHRALSPIFSAVSKRAQWRWRRFLQRLPRGKNQRG
jgi:hypothetical protein